MNTHTTENGSEHNSPLVSRRRSFFRAGAPRLHRTLFHARALLRLAHRRPWLALGLASGSVSALAAVGTAVSLEAAHLVNRAMAARSIAPLAPAPAPPAPPVELASTHHHHLLSFSINPLHGLASWYGSMWNGRKTASGEAFDDTKLTAAHKTLPLGTLVRVTNLASKQSVVVRINDRGSMSPSRIIDLSSAAAREIGLLDQGLARVKLEVLGRV